MTPERWEQIRDVLEKALELAPEQRSAFLDEACSSDPSLLGEVEALLACSDDVPSDFLQSSAMVDLLRAEINCIGSVGALEVGQVFAQRFELIRKLGEGGMGQVWLVEQMLPVRRHVALKLIKAGMYDEAVVQRFQSERQSLAIMDHPGIAKVFEAGTTPQGQPYFVMEYVPGLPITEYCDQKKLTIGDRLELFIQACEGVQHAHQKAIIHRDLKPANILVVEVDGKPVPRIIDFGLAKATTPQTASDALKTQFGHFVGTPGYMSPEQADASVPDIDTRTDVYSLGVVLYALLSGREPFESSNRQKQPIDELLRKLREEEPPRPSTRVSADHNSSTATAEARSTEPKQLARQLRGDLDWITMKALEKNRARRYGAASELAADVHRYLSHEPVLARPASAAYRCGKFIKRHKLALAVATVFALVVVAGAIATLREAQLARLQQARAEQHFESLRKLTNSMLFEFHDSIENLPGSTSARELVVSRALEYLQQIEADSPGDPATLRDLAAAYERIGRIRAEENHPHLGGAGSLHQAKQLYEKALAIRQRLAAANPGDISLQSDLLGTMALVGAIHYQLGDFDGAAELGQQRLKIDERLAASHDSEQLEHDIADSLISNGFLNIWLGDYNSALSDERRALAINQAFFDHDATNLRSARRVLISHNWVAMALKFNRQFAAAADEYRKALQVAGQLAVRDPNNTSVQAFLAGDNEELCKSLAYAGAFSGIRDHCQKAIAMNEGMVKSDKNNVQAVADLASSNVTMGLALYLMHAPGEALVYLRRADSMFRSVAVRDPDPLSNGMVRAVALLYAGRAQASLHQPDSARNNLEQAQTMLEELRMQSPRHRYILDALDETRAATKALPHDTAPLSVH
ncbi:MAG: protein kinase [Terracidiphilus sp.]|jgi:non-specific serine/threonine protein kinase/serine/threonine-protein kinase